MTKKIKPNEVIKNKEIKGKRKKTLDNKTRSSKSFNIIKTHKIASMILLFIIFFIPIVLFSINKISNNSKIITINNEDYTKSDFMIYLYSVKYNYFGEKNTNPTEDELNTMYDEETNQTVREYLKALALNEIKTASCIKKYASDNNIELTETDKKELAKEKKSYIKSIGGTKKFKKFLKHNNTSEKSYDKMSEFDKFYKKILKDLYSEGKINDLTKEEIATAKEMYDSHYFKIKQVILTTVDTSTGKNLIGTSINQKETLANSIDEMAKSGTNFDELIKKYSEDAIDKEPPYHFYYKKGELLTEIEEAVNTLNPGEISDVIKTKYAFHIIKREKLDDSKLNDYFDELREEKCVKALSEYLENLKIVYQKSYKKLKIK